VILGDALALLGALTVSFYYLSARRLRAKLDVWPYVALVYGSCFVVLLAMSAFTGTALAPQPPRELMIFAALALGPMLLGHTGFNWALKHVSAPTVSLVMLGEPVGATLIAMAVPAIREIPSARTLVGTPAYAAPERLRGEERRDPRTDLYSVGVILFQALAGQLPYKVDSFTQLVVKLSLEAAPKLRDVAPHVDPTLAAIVDWSMLAMLAVWIMGWVNCLAYWMKAWMSPRVMSRFAAIAPPTTAMNT